MSINYPLIIAAVLYTFTHQLVAQNVSFVVAADNREFSEQYRYVLREINDMTANPEPSMSFPQLFISCGDIDPVESNMLIYNDTTTYPLLPPYYPVVGNHEYETVSDLDYILNVLLPDLDNVVNTGKQGTYSFDYGNVHFIVLDQYSTNHLGEVDDDLRAWTQQDLNMTDQDHVFVFAHEPAFPRIRHVNDSMDKFPRTRDAFWKMLVLDPRVRAFFVGHTHYYSRMRVVDPALADSMNLDVEELDQEGGVYQVDVGAIGNPEGPNELTLVYVDVLQDSVRFRTIRSPRTIAHWAVEDEWNITGTKRFPMQMMAPLAGNEVAGTILVEWSTTEDLAPTLTTILYVSNNAGASWDTLGVTQLGETNFLWDTEQNPDGLNYMLRVFTKNDSGFARFQSADVFTINNPGNGLPDVELLSTQMGDLVAGMLPVAWNAADVDGDILTFSMDYSVDGGINWYNAFSNLQNTNEYLWDTNLAANSPNCRVVLRCNDGTVEVRDTSHVFEILNVREANAQLDITHVTGRGGGSINANIIDATLLTDNLYRIIFDDTSFSYKVYNIINVDTEEEVVRNAAEFDGVSEGPLFDGIRMLLRDLDQTEVDLENSGWQKGLSNWDYSIFTPIIWLGLDKIEGFPHPADYKISFFDEVSDTSTSLLNIPEIPMKFQIWNTTVNRKAHTLFIDNDNNQSISVGENVFILELDEQGELGITWKVLFSPAINDSTTIAPQAGDEFIFTTFNPFSSSDIYEFMGVTATNLETKRDVLPEKISLFHNYPNPFNPSTTIEYTTPTRRVIKIELFNALGERVEILVNKTHSAGHYKLDLNLQHLASGFYFYKLTSGTFEKTNKMILLK